jgi:hypothetical protein
VEEMLEIAETTGDADLLVTGHTLCICYCWTGDLTKVLVHFDTVSDLYDSEKHRYIADILSQDPKTVASIHLLRSASGYSATRTGHCD